jgi:hypothetical protein
MLNSDNNNVQIKKWNSKKFVAPLNWYLTVIAAFYLIRICGREITGHFASVQRQAARVCDWWVMKIANYMGV